VSPDEAMMAEALSEAQRGLEAGALPIGAVVALRETVLTREHWRYDGRRLLEHPELLALRGAERDHDLRRQRGGVTLYTTLEPCLLCTGAAMTFLVGRVVFALESPSDGASSVAAAWEPALGHPANGVPYRVPETLAGVGRAESLALVRAYLEREGDSPFAEWARTLVPA
jgi:tRNA(adenine34) deaminase